MILQLKINLPIKLIFILVFCLQTISANSQQNINQDFHFLLWPESSGWVASATDTDQIKERLLNTWHDSRLPIYLNQNLRVHFPKTKTLRNYIEFVESYEPHCIEGDFEFIQQEINQSKHRYSRLLDVVIERPKDLPNAELVIRNKPDGLDGVLGVVHPLLSNAGKAQIEYWEEQAGEVPNWLAFYSADEVIRHLLAGQRGSIQAAALPIGAFEEFLFSIGQENILDHFTIIPLKAPQTPSTIFLRNDLYQDLLQRTLIRETWLRNHFPDLMQLKSVTINNFN